jgi:histidinol-phosphatase (PHP family)
MDLPWDYHIHHDRCNHARGKLIDYIKFAITRGIKEIGLSDHWPMNLLPNRDLVENWAMNLAEIQKYIQEAIQLRNKFKHQINIKIAAEIDFCSAVFDAYKNQIQPYYEIFDYFIGSVHILQHPNGEYIPIDGVNNPKYMQEIGIETLYTLYFKELEKMITSDYFQIIGHFDLPKKYDVHPPKSIYPKILKLLDLIQKHEVVLEINTSGFRKKCKEQYPSDWIIQEVLKRKIPITFGSDAHNPKHIGYNFETILRNLKKWGKNLQTPIKLVRFKKKTPEYIIIT